MVNMHLFIYRTLAGQPNNIVSVWVWAVTSIKLYASICTHYLCREWDQMMQISPNSEYLMKRWQGCYWVRKWDAPNYQRYSTRFFSSFGWVDAIHIQRFKFFSFASSFVLFVCVCVWKPNKDITHRIFSINNIRQPVTRNSLLILTVLCLYRCLPCVFRIALQIIASCFSMLIYWHLPIATR